MKPLINNRFKLERFPGKGGWTFAQIPKVTGKNATPFGWKKVKGTIDGYEIRKFSVMPMSNGNMFLPVKAEIRKKIKKEAGDVVHIVLYPDEDPSEMPQEMLQCLKDEPSAHEFFMSLSDSEQNYYIKWIYSAKSIDTRVERLAAAINRLAKGLKFYDKK